jgi:pyrroline-5-carboxylate reductase
MSDPGPATGGQEAPRIGFIGWGPENDAMLKILAQAYPGFEGSASCFLPGGAGREAAPLAVLPTLEALFAACDTIVVEGPAQALEPVIPLIRLAIADRHVLVLMGRGWKLEAAQRHLNDRKLVRCLIRPFSGERNALLAFYPAPYLEPRELAAFRARFAHLELVLELESEAQFEVVLGLAGMAPAAFFTIMDALADGALMMGLPRGPALKFIASVLLACAQEMLTEGTHPAHLRDEALRFKAAAAGLMELESAGIRGLMMRAIREAMAEIRATPGGPESEE